MSQKRKQYIWLPYLGSIVQKPKNVKFVFKGGELETEWKSIHSIMLYGDSVDLPQEFLEKCTFYKIPIIIHRRNMSRAVIIASTLPSDQDNLLTKQILYRESEKKKSYIGKKLLQAKFQSMNWLFPIQRDLFYKVIHIEKMIQIESWHAKQYWKTYFESLEMPYTRRGKNHNVATAALDAVSKFVSGVILRWILYHNLSPYHGFLHKPTDYPALVYDLMEPYRGYFDKVVFDVLKDTSLSAKTESQVIALSIQKLKEILDKKVYVHSTRQIVTFSELLHGNVLALRAYISGSTRRFIVPIPSRPNGGRPIKAGYVLYGHTAGKTDFWERAREVTATSSVTT